MIQESISKIRKKYINKLKNYLSKSEVKRIAKDLKRLNIMPKGKIKHSIRVSDRLVDLDVDKDVILGALFHDYIERGGDIDKLSISEKSKDIVRFLTSFDDTYGNTDNEPLEHLTHVFGRIKNQKLKNRLVMIKVSDRVDNLRRRGKSVSKGYIKKSIELLRFLMSNYTGSVDLGKLLVALNRKLHRKISKRLQMGENVVFILKPMKVILTEAQVESIRNKSIIKEKLVLKSYDEYAKLVADAYDNAKNYDSSAARHWNSLNKSNYTWWKRLTSEARIEFVSGESKYKEQEGSINISGKNYPIKYFKGGEPYATASQMASSFKNDGVLYISIDHSNHPLFSLQDNIVFRTVHDYIVHIKGGFEFGLRGELGSYNLHAKLAPNDALPALFTEIVGQACYAVVRGDFPVQKIVVLEQFDHKRVGYVADYDVEDKQLVKKNGE